MTHLTSDGQINVYLGSVEEVTGSDAPYNCPDGSAFYAFKGEGAPKFYMYDKDNDQWIEQ